MIIANIIRLIKSCFLFWKNFFISNSKKEYIVQNSGPFKTQVIILLSLFLCGFVVYQSLKPVIKGACRLVLRADEDSVFKMEDRLIGVEAKKIISGTIQKEVTSIGNLKAYKEVIIKAEISGKISEILFKEGSEVKQGQELIKFEDTQLMAEKQKYESEYQAKVGDFKRVKELRDKKSVSEKIYDEALTQMKIAKAQFELACLQLSKSVLRAPFDGKIGILRDDTSPGNTVQQHTELVNIVDNSLMKIWFSVPVKYKQDIAVGQIVEITIDASTDSSENIFYGRVTAIDSGIDHKNQSILVQANIQNKNRILDHGMFASVKLITGEKSGVILINEEALDREGPIEFVWVIDEKGRAYRRRVLTGSKEADGKVEVLSGLKENEIVVMTGQLKLSDGVKVNIMNNLDPNKNKAKAGIKYAEEQ
ncbi:MAG: efflux RND transporter periplasmic adaptor subunit [Holosporales bacterium]|jgi:membrane fusion protein (multidrug efflux system)|nr:efflux RND transporter periplasmic adaptor subunit [Holosporales bacterium]